MKALHNYIARHEKLAKVSHKSETVVHAAYCSVLFIEGHGFYAVIGGVLGLIVVINFLMEE